MSHRLALTLVCATATVFACDPRPHPYPCRAFRLQIADKHKVLSTYKSGYFSTECPAQTPQEILVAYPDYSVYLYSMANQDPKLFIGVVPVVSRELRLEGAEFSRIPAGAAIDGRASHWTRASVLEKDRINFEVIEETTGKRMTHSYSFAEVDCKCKSYDAL